MLRGFSFAFFIGPAVQAGFAFGPRFKTTMQPQILIGIATYFFFDNGIDAGGVGQQITGLVTAGKIVQGGEQGQLVAAIIFSANWKKGYDFGAGHFC